VVVSLPCTNLGSATKRLKESDLVVTHPVILLVVVLIFENTKTTMDILFMDLWEITSLALLKTSKKHKGKLD